MSSCNPDPSQFLYIPKLYKNFVRTFSYFKDVFSSYSYKQEIKPTGQQQEQMMEKTMSNLHQQLRKQLFLFPIPVIATTAPALPNLQSGTTAVLNTHIQEVFHRWGITHSL